MFIDITKLDRKQVKEIVLSAGWWWDESKSIAAEEDRRDVERLVNEAYVRGFKVGINSRTRIAEVVGAWGHKVSLEITKVWVDEISGEIKKEKNT